MRLVANQGIFELTICPMKYLLSLFLIFSMLCSYGQQTSGNITDAETHVPVTGALISMGTARAFTNSVGEFTIDATGADTIKVTKFGYQTYIGPISKAVSFMHIKLTPAKVALKEVVIHSNREAEYKKDSLENRTFYDKQFNYVGPKVTDAFIPAIGNHSTSELISINPILLVQALTKKSTPEYKFKKTLLRDEQDKYVDQKFNRGNVSKITGLKGDTLANFMVQYRPDFKFAQKATEYDMELYINDCLKKFKSKGMKDAGLFAPKN